MSAPLPLSGKRWSDLPECLQAHILSFLSKERTHPDIEISLNSAMNITNPLPNDLLSIANISEDFATLVANALGTRARYLTNDVANGELPKWVSILAPVLKAVSTWDSQFWEQSDENVFNQPFFHVACQDALKLFKSLSENTVALEVLDLLNIPFGRPCRTKQDRQGLLHGLISTLKQNCASLKQLALPVSKICAKALEEVRFQRLEVFELEFRNFHDVRLSRRRKKIYALAFLDMLRSIDGHGDTPRRVSTIHDLRLRFLYDASPYISKTGEKLGLFTTVTTLYLDVVNAINRDNESYAMFISLFPNVKYLRWNGGIKQTDLQMVNRACPNIEQLHLRCRRCAHQSNIPEGEWEKPHIEDTLSMSQGKVKTLIVETLLTTEQLKAVGEKCPDLEHLGLEMCLENVDGLGLLFRSYCRHIRKLELSIVWKFAQSWNSWRGGLEPENWYAMKESVCCASEELTELCISVSDPWNEMKSPEEAMVGFLLDMIEFLGDRARKIEVKLGSVKPPQYAALNDSVGRILRKCAILAKGLEHVRIGFWLGRLRGGWSNIEEAERDMLLGISKAKRDLIETMPNLRSVRISQIDEGRLEELEEFEQGGG